MADLWVILRVDALGFPRLGHGTSHSTLITPHPSLDAGVLRHAETIFQTVGAFTPRHQVFVAEGTVAADRDHSIRPCSVQAIYDPFEQPASPFQSRRVAGTQDGGQREFAAEDELRQKAVVVIMAVEELAELLAIRGDVAGVDVEHDLGRRLKMLLDEDLHQQIADAREARDDFAVGRVRPGAGFGEFEPVECALSGERFSAIGFPSPILPGGVFLSNDGGESRIAAQIIVINQVFIAETDPVNPLPEQVEQRMLDDVLLPMIFEAVGESFGDVEDAIDLSDQLDATVSRDVPAFEVTCNNSFGIKMVKLDSLFVTRCLHVAPSSKWHKVFLYRVLCRIYPPGANVLMRNSG
jgi:hypothetical protein